MTVRPARLRSCSRRLSDEYGLLSLDLDGVVYLLDHAIEGVSDTLAEVRRAGGRPVFVTNNASRSPETVAGALRGLGIAAEPGEVLTSARTAAVELAGRLPDGAEVLVVGAPALVAEVERVGLRPVAEAGDGVRAVVQGYAADVSWRELAEATVAIRGGALWVATNPDRTLPSKRGPLPGNGALLAAVRTAVEREPDLVAGKPGPVMFRQAAREAPDARPLVVGDRWDTDIEGAVRAGQHSLLVLSGITGPAEVLRIPEGARPDYLGWSLPAVLDVHEGPRWLGGDEPSVACGGWTAVSDGEVLRLAGSGDALDALRALAELAWEVPGFVKPVASDDGAAEALRVLGLS